MISCFYEVCKPDCKKAEINGQVYLVVAKITFHG